MDEAEEWKEWELQSNNSSDSEGSGGWIDIPSEGSDLELSDDSDDEGHGNKSRKKRKLDKQAKLDETVLAAKVVLPLAEVVADDEEDVILLEDAADDGDDADTEKEKEDEAQVASEEEEDVIVVPEMSIEQANVELAGTTFADLATTKVRLQFILFARRPHLLTNLVLISLSLDSYSC